MQGKVRKISEKIHKIQIFFDQIMVFLLMLASGQPPSLAKVSILLNPSPPPPLMC